jgi:predicted transcriptional regulator
MNNESKSNRKYLKTALRMLRQGNSMLLKASQAIDMDDVSKVTANMYDDIEEVLKQTEFLKDYLSAQYSMKFEDE